MRGCLKTSIFLLVFLYSTLVYLQPLDLNASWVELAYAETALDKEWLEQKSTHFIIYYKKEPSPGYIKKVIDYAESYYNKIVDGFGFRRFNFWTWNKRCKIFLYFSQEQYYNDTGQPLWSGGEVRIRERKISTYIHGEDFLSSVLPHEMGHLIFREFVGYKTYLPLWLDEGMACLNERKYRKERLLIARGLVRANMYIPLQELTNINDPELIVMPNIFYAESASAVDFLLAEFGKDKFLAFCRKIRDGQDWEESLKKVYKFKDLSELNEKWVEFLSKRKF